MKKMDKKKQKEEPQIIELVTKGNKWMTNLSNEKKFKYRRLKNLNKFRRSRLTDIPKKIDKTINK